MPFIILKKTFNLFISKKIFYNKATRFRIIATTILIFIDIISTSLIAYYSKVIINSLTNNVLYSIWVAVILLGGFWIVQKTIIHIQEIIFFPVINFAIREVTYKVVEHIHKIPLVDYQKLSISEVISSIRRISISARTFIKILILMLFPTIIKLIIAVCIAIKMGFLGLLFIPTIIIGVILFYKGINSYMYVRDLAWQTTDKVASRINDSLLNTKIIRSFADLEMDQVCNLLSSEAEIWYKTNTKLHSLHIMIGILLGVCITIVLSGIILAIQKSKLTIGDFIFLKNQLIAVWLPLKNLTVEFRQLLESLIDIKKIIEILELPKVSKDLNINKIHINDNINYNNNDKHINNYFYIKDATIPSALVKDIYIDNIDFKYNKSKTIFKNFSLTIFTGEKVGITGNIGSGKSTLINLMSGLYQLDEGAIYIKGQNIKNISRDFLQTKTYFIHQDFKLFNASLFYNLTYGIKNISIMQLQNFINNLNFMQFIKQMSLGLNTKIGEKGIILSPGEQQKILLCRALLLKPEILFLDETTNSLSYEVEMEILNLLFANIPTVILVSHRINNNNNLCHSLSKILHIDLPKYT